MNDEHEGSSALPWIIGCSAAGCLGVVVLAAAAFLLMSVRSGTQVAPVPAPTEKVTVEPEEPK